MGGVRSRYAGLLLFFLALSCGRTAHHDGSSTAPSTPEGDSGTAPPAATANCAVALASAGAEHCAVYQDGSVWCWGMPGTVTLSVDEPPEERVAREPTRLAGISGAKSIVLGPRNGCALTGDGAYCWGDNDNGQIDDSRTRRDVPTLTQLSLGRVPITNVGIDANHICALDAESHVYCRGDSRAPYQVEVEGGPTTRMPGPGTEIIDDQGRIFSLKVPLHPGQRREWGADNQQLSGNGWVLKRSGSVWLAAAAPEAAPLALLAVAESAVQVAGGNDFGCALTQLGKVWCQGANDQGQSGVETSPFSSGEQLPSLSEVRRISAASESACALRADGSVWCWGDWGQPEASFVPRQVTGCSGQLNPPALPSLTPASAAERVAEASLAHAQAMCLAAQPAPSALQPCIEEEDHGPNPICQAAIGDIPDFLNCWADRFWELAACYRDRSLRGEPLTACVSDRHCTAPGGRMVTQQCWSRTCGTTSEPLKKRRICDGVLDCSDGSDERNCTANGQFECLNGESTVSLSQLCDGITSCADGSDESTCVTPY